MSQPYAKFPRPWGDIRLDAPVLVDLAALSLAVLFLRTLLGEGLDFYLAVYPGSLLDITLYPRLLLHVLLQRSLSEYVTGFLILLAVGPRVERQLGSAGLLLSLGAAAVVSGLLYALTAKGTMLAGPESLIYAVLLLSLVFAAGERDIPFTTILILVLYLGNGIAEAFASGGMLPRLAPALGGLAGAGVALLTLRKRAADASREEGQAWGGQ